MAINQIERAYQSSITNPVDLAVAVALANHADDGGGNCFPRLETIAEETRYCFDTVQKAVIRLEQAGHLARKRRFAKSTCYVLHFKARPIDEPELFTDETHLPTTPINGADPYIGENDVHLSATSDSIYRPDLYGNRQLNVKEPSEGEKASPPPAAEPPLDASIEEELVAKWNALPFTKIREMNQKRRAALRARLGKAKWKSEWREGIDRIAKSSFCRGEAGRRGWKATINWFLRPDTLNNILEGQYDDRPARQNGTPVHSSPSTPSDSDQGPAGWKECAIALHVPHAEHAVRFRDLPELFQNKVITELKKKETHDN